MADEFRITKPTIGHAKAHLQHVLTATALNLVRVAAWLEGTTRAAARRSAFAALAA
jgi:transposase